MDRRTVKKRRIFYIPGFDPFHPRRYRELYRKESALQADISNYEIDQNATGMGPYAWRINSIQDRIRTEADMHVLVWSDIVKSSMSAGIAATYWQLLQTSWIYISSGALRRLSRMRKGPVIAALYPEAVLLAELAVALLVACCAYFVSHYLAMQIANTHGVAIAISAAVALGTLIVMLRWWKKKDPRIYAYYLMHDFAFAARWRGANPPALEARMRDFGDQIADALASDVDEVLVIGHSSGAHLAVSILADLLRENRIPTDGPALSFLSLGQVVPMMSFLPEAKRLRRDLHDLAQTDTLFWVDVSAPADGACFALCDPVAVSGVAPEHKQQPLVLSAAYSHNMLPETYERIRKRYFKLHFQYLCAFDAAGEYDYFRITAGPQTLSARFGHRSSSPNTITTPHSKFTSQL